MKKFCQLCEREVPSVSEHHVIPKSLGGKDTIEVCKDCHRQIHALFDNKKLSTELNRTELIINNESFSKYLKWIRNRPYGSAHKSKRSRETRKRGRRG